jgi:hypothetical protein
MTLDDISREWIIQSLAEAGGFVLGRRTYESFARSRVTFPRRSPNSSTRMAPASW